MWVGRWAIAGGVGPPLGPGRGLTHPDSRQGTSGAPQRVSVRPGDLRSARDPLALNPGDIPVREIFRSDAAGADYPEEGVGGVVVEV